MQNRKRVVVKVGTWVALAGGSFILWFLFRPAPKRISVRLNRAGTVYWKGMVQRSRNLEFLTNRVREKWREHFP
jgi:hypothetical protein